MGSASCEYSANLGGADSLALELTTVVGDHYTIVPPATAAPASFALAASAIDTEIVIMIVEAGDGKVSGGGQLEMDNSAGMYAADPALRTNYGFNAQAAQKGKKTQVKGRTTIIIRAADGHKYKIRSNAILSLGADLDPDGDPTTDHPRYAEFEAKANLTDVTDPLNPISMGGNLLLQLRMTDNGETGENDTISYTVWDGGTLLFSTNWDGAQSVEQNVARGNLQVH